MKERLIHFVTDKPKLSFFISLVLSVIMIMGIPKINQNFSPKIWFKKTDPNLIEFEKFEKKFGTNESYIILIHHKDTVFSKETATAIQEITDDAWLISDTIRVDSLATHNWSYSEDNDIIIEPFLTEEIINDPALLSKRANQAKEDSQIVGYLTNEKLNVAVINGVLKPVFDSFRDHEKVYSELKSLKLKYQQKYPNLKLSITGISPLSATIKQIAVDDLQLILPLILLTLAIVTGIIFKSILVVIYTLVMVTFSLLTTAGFAGHLSLDFNILTSMIPSIVLAISLADAIHLLSSYFYFKVKKNCSAKEAVKDALNKNIRATTLTTISTSVGFLSLTLTDLEPIQVLGCMAAAGAIFAWFLTIFFLMPLVQMTNIQTKYSLMSKIDLGNLLPTVEKYRVPIITLSLFAFIFSIYEISLAKVNSSTMDTLKESLEIKKDTNFMIENVGGFKTIVLLLKTDKSVRSPEFLEKADEYINWLRSFDFISNVSSLVDITKQLNQSLNSDNKEFYSIPKKQESISQSLFLYELGLPSTMSMNMWQTPDHKELKITLQYELPGSSYVLPYLEKFKNKAEEMGLNMKVTGQMALGVKQNDYIMNTFVTSMFSSMVAIFILMILIFKSLKIGLISMIPNIFPPICGLGLMSFLDIDLNVGTVLITSVSLGICVDDTIYFVNDYVSNAKYDPKERLKRVLSHTGIALIFTTFSLVATFACFSLGNFKPNIHFGLITAFVFLVALFADLFLLPAILLNNKESK